mmetsp:Transcript_20384/g.63345  ORF Transcript_20384/g.63345 Transcript_20384/m.63345 type:complete len:247 (+) Transcript_20384:440-1180(+)
MGDGAARHDRHVPQHHAPARVVEVRQDVGAADQGGHGRVRKAHRDRAVRRDAEEARLEQLRRGARERQAAHHRRQGLPQRVRLLRRRRLPRLGAVDALDHRQGRRVHRAVPGRLPRGEGHASRRGVPQRLGHGRSFLRQRRRARGHDEVGRQPVHGVRGVPHRRSPRPRSEALLAASQRRAGALAGQLRGRLGGLLQPRRRAAVVASERQGHGRASRRLVRHRRCGFRLLRGPRHAASHRAQPEPP